MAHLIVLTTQSKSRVSLWKDEMMNQGELNTIFAAHAEWLASQGVRGVRADLTGADLRGAHLQGADLSEADLRGAHLCGAHLRGARLRGADLERADLTGADLRRADMRRVDLREADLQAADMRGTYLQDANLWGADLRGANLWGADLRGANLREVNLQDANLRDCTGNRAEVKSLSVITVYPITYTADMLQIGCERHLISEWAQFDDDRIMRMDGSDAMRFWRKWKDYIFMTIEKSPAKPTGYKEG